jgi:8-oxo-dGTP pyrophosphatase MutT (NUDIX family)
MRWTVRSERSLYADEWLDLRLADVELPDGRHLNHRLLRMAASAGAVVIDRRQRALLIWRHRFITGLWGWEMPMGMINAGESPAEAAAREVEEETGWRPGRLRPLAYAQPSAGIMDAAHHLFVAGEANEIGRPADAFESTRIEWIPLADVPALIAKRESVSASTMAALPYLLAMPSAQEAGAPPFPALPDPEANP